MEQAKRVVNVNMLMEVNSVFDSNIIVDEELFLSRRIAGVTEQGHQKAIDGSWHCMQNESISKAKPAWH